MEQNREYYAFISYQREDERWAKWLQHKLEHYRLPSNLNGRTDLPREIRPVFRDTSELNPGNLPQQIRDALAASKHLIVVCSPRSASSLWVNLEVEEFIKMGKGDCIIPFIVDGRPFADDPSEECFPPAIRDLPKEQELLGANVNEMGRDAAAVKTVAQMFGVRFDSLWKRYEREQKRKRALVIAAVSLFVLAVLGVAAYILQQNFEIKKKREELQKAYSNLSTAKDSIQAQYGIIQRTNADLSQAKDSIQYQYGIIQRTNADLSQAKDSIQYQYGIIEETNVDLRRTNDARARAQSRAAAEAAIKIAQTGDSYKARQVAFGAWNISPTIEAEIALRQSCQYNNSILKHDDKVLSAAFSPDGKHVVTTAEDKKIRIWDVDTRSCILTMHDPMGIIFTQYGRDGKSVFSVSECDFDGNSCFRIWDAITGQCLQTLKFYGPGMSLGMKGWVKLSPDEKYIVSNMRYTNILDMIDITTGQCHVFKGHSSNVFSAAFSPDGRLLVSGSKDNTMRIWDINSQKCLRIIESDSDVRSVTFSPDGKRILSISSSGNTRIWDVSTGKNIRTLDKWYGGIITTAAYSPDGKFIVTTSLGRDNSICIWDAVTFDYLKSLNGHVSMVKSVSFDSRGKYLVSCSSDKTVHLWDVTQLKGKISIPRRVWVSPNVNRIVSFPEKDTVRIWDMITGRSTCTSLNGYSSQFRRPIEQFLPDGRRLLSASMNDSSLRIWDVFTGKCIRTFVGHKNRACLLVVSPDGKYFVSSSDKGDIRVWNTETGKTIWTVNMKNHSRFLDQVSFGIEYSPDGCYIAIVDAPSTSIRNAKTGKELYVIENGLIPVFSQDGKIFLTRNEETVRIWETSSGKCLQKFDNINIGLDKYDDIEFSPDGKYIVLTSHHSTIKLWDISAQKCTRKMDDDWQFVHYVRFSHDGKYIVSISSNDMMHIWDVSTGKLIQKQSVRGGIGYSVSRVNFSLNDRYVVLEYGDYRAICIFEFPELQQLIDETRERFKDNPLTPEERRRYYLE